MNFMDKYCQKQPSWPRPRIQLIIDVERDYYEMLKYNVEHGQDYKPFEIIANGIPYENRPQVEHKPACEDCDYRKFTEQFISGVVDVMTKNGISSLEELNRRLKGEES